MLRRIEEIDAQFERFLYGCFSCVPLRTLDMAPVATELPGSVADF